MTVVLVYLAKCIDLYIKQSVHNATAPPEAQKEIDKSLEEVVNRMFKRCFDDRQFKQVSHSYRISVVTTKVVSY